MPGLPPPNVSFPGGIGIQRAQPRPTAPITREHSQAGGELQKFGADLENQDTKKRAQQEQEARLQDMVRRRELANKVQATREEWKQKEQEFNDAKVIEDKRRYEAEEKRKDREFKQRELEEKNRQAWRLKSLEQKGDAKTAKAAKPNWKGFNQDTQRILDDVWMGRRTMDEAIDDILVDMKGAAESLNSTKKQIEADKNSEMGIDPDQLKRYNKDIAQFQKTHGERHEALMELKKWKESGIPGKTTPGGNADSGSTGTKDSTGDAQGSDSLPPPPIDVLDALDALDNPAYADHPNREQWKRGIAAAGYKHLLPGE